MVLFVISCVVKKLPQKSVKLIEFDKLVSDHYLLLDKEQTLPCSGINGTVDTALLMKVSIYISHQHQQADTHIRPGRSSSLIASFLLSLAGDIELNPGPYKPKHPCLICTKAVRWNQKAVQCDQCDGWYHKECMGMSTHVYEAMAGDISWICCSCGIPNFSSALFTDTMNFTLQNSFSSIATPERSIGSVQSPDPLAAPMAASSPRPRPDPKGTSSKWNNLKVVVLNCQGLKAKQEVFAEMVLTINPDVIIGTESHLKADIKNAEVFPSNYDQQIHRVDRRDGRKGGGVFIVARDDIDLTPLPEQTPPSSETAWAELMTTCGKVIIGAHYRPLDPTTTLSTA